MTYDEAVDWMYELANATGVSATALIQAIKIIATQEPLAECPDCSAEGCDKNH